MHSKREIKGLASIRSLVVSPLAYTIALAVFIGAAVLAQSPSAPVSGTESIQIEELRAKVYHLASDEFRGRGDGTPELDAAATYIAGVFEENGLTPVGDNGYFQEFQVDRLSLGENNRLEIAGTSDGRSLEFSAPSDFVPWPGSVDGMASGPMIFVGYGIQAPELGYDDFAAVSLDGGIAVVLDGVPAGNDPNSVFNELTDRERSSILSKAIDAQQAGATALVVVQGPLHGATTSVRALAATLRPNLPPRRSVMRRAPRGGDPTIPIVVVEGSAAERLVPNLASMQAAIDREFRTGSVSLGGTATLRVDFDRDDYTARNVIARIEGSDASLTEELMIVGAHYDHDGEDNGRIWNGADDDASGTSALLELAEAFSGGPRPGRSILLSAWAAEEKGMLGSQHYVRDPVAPLEQTVAMFQLDMIGRNEDHPPDASQGFDRERASENGNMINVIGSVFSPEFRQAVERANSNVGLELRFRYDYRAQNLIRRSDHWSFLSARIPALFFFGGLHPDYHTPNDTADKINYEKLEKVVRLTYLALLEVGDAPTGPRFTIPMR